jgi:pimeloyl-ACP methyl ester carboxylesterase
VARLELISWAAADKRHDAPLLFVHGAWHGAWCWEVHLLGYFAGLGYDAHALSLRGHGKSAGRERLRWARVRDYVVDVREVVDRLGPDTVLIGHSMGGLVVQKYLERRSARAAVLMASVPPTGVLSLTLRFAQQHPLRFAHANGTLSLYPLVATPEAARELFFSADLPDAEVREYQARLSDESYLAYLDMLALDLPRPSRVTTPILVLGGEADAIFTVQQVRDTATAYHTEAVVLPGVAHDMMLDTGWRATADEIAGWLEHTLR